MFWGIKLIKNYDGIILTQSHHVDKLLKKFNYFLLKKFNYKYSQIIDSLLYLTIFSKLDIAYAYGKLGKYTYNFTHSHWTT